MTRFALCLMLLALAGCGGGTAADMQADAQAALESADYDAALAKADAALAKAEEEGGDRVAVWGIQNVRLNALTRSGASGEAIELLDSLAGDYSDQIKAETYRAAASDIKAAGDITGALEVMQAGEGRFGKEPFAALLESYKKEAESDSGIKAALEALGYLEK